MLAHLSDRIAARELETVARGLSWEAECLETRLMTQSAGPGNVLLLEIQCEAVHEVITSFGARGTSAETVAERAVEQVKDYIANGAPIGVHLADQILLPLALAGAGSYRTLPPSRHLLTNIDVIRQFLDVEIRTEALESGCWQVSIGERS